MEENGKYNYTVVFHRGLTRRSFGKMRISSNVSIDVGDSLTFPNLSKKIELYENEDLLEESTWKVFDRGHIFYDFDIGEKKESHTLRVKPDSYNGILRPLAMKLGYKKAFRWNRRI